MPEAFRTALRAQLAILANGADFTDTDDLFESGAIKSLHLIELIAFVEDTFRIELHERDVFEGRLRSVEQLLRLVAERRSVA
ncbi:MAG: acyl carrier protein [Deltaproteobacteria bacterium]|nr:acyl carrier protein [Deltaproteobacteria bacterium]